MSASLLEFVRSDLAMLNKLNRAVMLLPVDVSSGPANEILAGATSRFVSPQHAPVSLTAKKFPPPAWRAGPALNAEFANWMRGLVPMLVNCAPWATKNPEQQAEPNAELSVLKLLPFVAANSGPESVSLVGLARARDRLRISIPPAGTTSAPSNDRSGAAPVLVTVALSPTNMKPHVSVAGFPLLSVVFTALRSGPERPADGGNCRVPEANDRKLPPCPAGTPVPVVAEPPLIERSGLPEVLVRTAPLKTPRSSCPLEMEESTALSSGP